MTEEKTKERVHKRSVEWIEGGAITIAVSLLLTISWRVYTAGKIPFWSAWPGILGVAVVGVGILMLVAGAALQNKAETGDTER